MSENLKTIKELADELGVSKDKIKYRVRKIPRELTTKENGIIYLKKEAIKAIYEELGVKIPIYNKVGRYTIPTKNKTTTINTDFLLEELKNKDIQLENKNKQIDNLIESQKQTQNLLDQQQRLALQDKQLLQEYKAENDKLKSLKMPSGYEGDEPKQEPPLKALEFENKALKEELSEQKERREEELEKLRAELTKPKKWYEFWR